MPFIPKYNGYLPGSTLVLPKNDSWVSKPLEIIKTLIPLLALNKDYPGVPLLGVPVINIGHIMLGFSESSFKERHWVLPRNLADLAIIFLLYISPLKRCSKPKKTAAITVIHTMHDILESSPNLLKTIKQPLQMESVGPILEGVGNCLYFAENVQRFRKGQNLRKTTLISLVVQGLYQAFQLRSQGLKLLQQERVINYQNCQLALDVTVKAILTLVRLGQAYQIWAQTKPDGKL